MTEIAFYFNVPSRTEYACRLLRRAQRQGVSLAVTGPAAILEAIDRELWCTEPTDFVAHARVADLAAVPTALRKSTVWLAENAADAPCHDALVNLGEATPKGFESFGRLVEIVSTDEADRAVARERWKAYAKRGYPIKRHEVSA